MNSVRDILARVKGLLHEAGGEDFLVGYDVNEIQAFVGASSRPVVMRGASKVIHDFDQRRAPNYIFAGGGQGITVCRGEEVARRERESIERSFVEATCGERLVTEHVRLDPGAPIRSRRWLRQKLAIQKDAIAKSDEELPVSRQEQCASCDARKATVTRKRRYDDGRTARSIAP